MLKLLLFITALLVYGTQVALAAFGLTHTDGFFVVDTGGGLVFKGDRWLVRLFFGSSSCNSLLFSERRIW